MRTAGRTPWNPRPLPVVSDFYNAINLSLGGGCLALAVGYGRCRAVLPVYGAPLLCVLWGGVATIASATRVVWSRAHALHWALGPEGYASVRYEVLYENHMPGLRRHLGLVALREMADRQLMTLLHLRCVAGYVESLR